VTGATGPAGALAWSAASSSLTASANSGYFVDASGVTITLPSGCIEGQEIDVLGDGSGFTVALGGGSLVAAPYTFLGWTDQTSAGSRNWFSLASDSTGQNLVAAVSGGDIWTRGPLASFPGSSSFVASAGSTVQLVCTATANTWYLLGSTGTLAVP
jgi:hypothetical protein